MKSETKKIIITILNFVILGANFLLKVFAGEGVSVDAGTLSLCATALVIIA